MLKIYQRFKSLFIILFGYGICSPGCNTINPAEQVPTYIHIDSFHFVQTNPQANYDFAISTTAREASPAPISHQINVAWVYYNNNPVGIFDLPATFPIITNGTSGILEVYPGILADGENNDIVNYSSFNTPDTFTFSTQPGKVINHTPVTGYTSGVNIGVISNFEDPKTGFGPCDGTTLGIKKLDKNLYPDSVFWDGGQYSGMIALYAPTVDSAIDSSFSFPIASGVAYIEFDYNTTVDVYIGLQANESNLISSTPYYLTGIYPNTGWQKFYLEVDGFTANTQGTSYNLYIKAVLPSGQTSGRLLIDNIQIVTN
jgi:hypothetical protein